MRVGVDIGGTFTDVAVQTMDGALRSWKVSSTPPDFSPGVLEGLEIAAHDLGMSRSHLLGQTSEFVHGTTVTTNIIMTRDGERVGLLTTRGFADTYELARQYRGIEQDPALVSHPSPLIPREDIEEIDERIDYRGEIVSPINEARVEEAVTRLAERGIRSFAICFLWSFRNSVHEELAKRLVLKLVPDAYVAASFESCPVLGEYERTSTVALTAFAGPALRRYASNLETQLRESGFEGTLLLMKSDGGLCNIESAVRAAGQTVYSGPAAGVMAAKALSETLSEPRVITFDMGGTSTDVAIIHDGQVGTTSLQFIERQALAASMIDITIVGAGGGSIASLSAEDTLQVGPTSAGAIPGPACFGRGGNDPTVTDANVLLGLFGENTVLSGGLVLNQNQAEHALAALSARLGLPTVEIAHGIFRVANSVMADAIRLRTVFSGLDPREFVLASFGGAGGLHCAAVAIELGMSRVLIPRSASVFSALGLVSTDVTYTAARADLIEIDGQTGATPEQIAHISDAFEGLEGQVTESLDSHAIPAAMRTLTRSVEMSYRRQILNFEVAVPRRVDAVVLTAVLRDFDNRYARIYGPGAAAPESGYTLKACRVTGLGGLAKPLIKVPEMQHGQAARPVSHRKAITDVSQAVFSDVPVYDGNTLVPGMCLVGPALIEYSDTTILAPRGSTVTIDAHANITMELR